MYPLAQTSSSFNIHSRGGDRYDLEALRAGDPEARRRLIVGERVRVLRVILQRVADRDEAEGLMQETFLQAFLHIDTFEGRSRLSTWLCGIAVNLTRTFLRDARRYQSYTAEDFDWLHARQGATLADEASLIHPEVALEEDEQSRALHAALQQLPEEYRAVVILCYMKGYSTVEAAHALSISHVNARVRLHRARNKLRSLLTRREGDVH